MRQFKILFFTVCFFLAGLIGCDQRPLNSPYVDDPEISNVYYASFAESPKTLDPAKSYSADESVFTAQIYEPPLQYHYLKRPYTLIPLTAASMPTVRYIDASGKTLSETAPPESVVQTIYDIYLKPGILYQPHPAFAKEASGEYRYHHLSLSDIAQKKQLSDFPHRGTRELIAADYVYQIKRLADPRLQSPIFGVMSRYIEGMTEFAEKIRATKPALKEITLSGVKVIDRYHYQIHIKGKYPQFIYWLAMPFFSPMPWEADAFYQQAGMGDNNMTLDWHPIGTGPYQLLENNPNRRMVLAKNPNFHPEYYPEEGMREDIDKGLLNRAGEQLPFIERIVFTLEKESIPRWTKFLQGYYDASGISSDSFDQAIRLDLDGQPQLTDEMTRKNIRLETDVGASIFYLGFNMRDPIVGGYTERARKLRQAIAIAVDIEEFIAIFLNGRGLSAQGPIPPGVFGYQAGAQGINPYLYDWKNGHMQRKLLSTAKQWLVQAGYPNGIDPKTGRGLVLNYDVPSSNGPDDKARLEWMRKQFAKLGIQLNVRGTLYNRFQEKMRTGGAQIFFWGWQADYPDPENFLFLLYGENGKVKYGGENAANYENAEYDQLFRQMKTLPNGPEREKIILSMLEIVRRDAPWIFGFHPKNFGLYHQWVGKTKPSEMGNNTVKYTSIDPKLRQIKQREWNHAIWWPLGVLAIFIILLLLPVGIRFWQQEHKKGRDMQ